jgi:hypothetical protein
MTPPSSSGPDTAAAAHIDEMSRIDNAQAVTAMPGYPQFPQVHPQGLIGQNLV